MAEAALQIESPEASRLVRAFTNLFAWTSVSLGVFLFAELFILFGLGFFSISWSRSFFQFTQNLNLDLINCIVSPAVGLFFAAYWEMRTPPPVALERYRYWLQVVMRYIVAFTFLEYGFAKVFKQQFFTYLSTLDMPLGELTGLELAWRFFGYSYLYTLFIASSQIVSATLLFFRRTTTLAAAMLLPIIANIVFINFTHHIPVRLESITLLLMVLYLLLTDFERLKAVFWDHTAVAARSFTPYRAGARLRYGKYLVMAFFIVFAVGENYKDYLLFVKTTTPLHGAWDVQDYQLNGVSQASANDAGIWRRLYIESDKSMTIKTGQTRPQEIESDVPFDLSHKAFRWTDVESNDIFLEGSYDVPAPDQLLISGTRGGDTIRVTLKKVR